MDFRDLTDLRKWAVWLLYAYLAVSVFGAISEYLQVQLLQRMQVGDFTTQDAMVREATANDTRQQYVAIAELIAFAVSGIVALMWTHGAARNARGLAEWPAKFTPGWAVGWYFVPFANLVQPYQAMKEIWQRSAWPEGRSPNGVLGWWWALWIASNIVAQIYLRIVADSSDLPTLITGSYIGVASELATIALIIVYIQLITRVTAMQEEKYAARRATQPVPQGGALGAGA